MNGKQWGKTQNNWYQSFSITKVKLLSIEAVAPFFDIHTNLQLGVISDWN